MFHCANLSFRNMNECRVCGPIVSALSHFKIMLNVINEFVVDFNLFVCNRDIFVRFTLMKMTIWDDGFDGNA